MKQEDVEFVVFNACVAKVEAVHDAVIRGGSAGSEAAFVDDDAEYMKAPCVASPPCQQTVEALTNNVPVQRTDKTLIAKAKRHAADAEPPVHVKHIGEFDIALVEVETLKVGRPATFLTPEA